MSTLTAKTLKVGDPVTLEVRGAGVTSFEPHTIQRLTRSVVWVDDHAYMRATGKRVEAPMFGFDFMLRAPRG